MHQFHRIALLTLLGVGLLTCGLVLQKGGPDNETHSNTPTIEYHHVGIFEFQKAQYVYILAVAKAYAETIATPTPTYISQERWSSDISGTTSGNYQFDSGAEQWRSLVCNTPFTWPCEWALAVINCESGGNPNAQGIESNGAGGLWYFNGLFQVWNGMFDPYQNAVEAHIKYHNGGTRHWPNCP